MNFARWIIAAGTLALISACRPSPVDLSTGTRNYKPKHYETVLKRWTRHGRVIRHFDTNLRVAATYWSWDFTWAYAVKYARVFRLNKKRAAALRAGLLREKSKHHEFYVAATTQMERWNDFEEKDSIWKITLIDEKGRQLDPVEIDKIDPVTAVHKTFFPYTRLFYMAYVVRFAKNHAGGDPAIAPTARKFTLQFAGPKGVVRLTWKTRK